MLGNLRRTRNTGVKSTTRPIEQCSRHRIARLPSRRCIDRYLFSHCRVCRSARRQAVPGVQARLARPRSHQVPRWRDSSPQRCGYPIPQWRATKRSDALIRRKQAARYKTILLRDRFPRFALLSTFIAWLLGFLCCVPGL